MSTWVIDTNILEHLLFTAPAVLNAEGHETTPAGCNHDGHITLFLKYLITADATLALDDKERIRGEYRNRLEKRIKEAPESTSRQLLMWAIESSSKIKKKVNHADGLMAAASNCSLATNNVHHINNVKKELKKCAKTHAGKGLEIYDSHQALDVVKQLAQ